MRFRLNELLEEQRREFPSQAEVARRSGVSTVAVNAIVHSKTGGIEFDTLDRLYEALDCEVGEPIERVPSKRGSAAKRAKAKR